MGARRDKKFLTRGQRCFFWEHGLLSKSRSNPQISPRHCFQEVHSHRLSMEVADLGTLLEVQATELDCKASICLSLCVACSLETACTGRYATVSVCEWWDDTLRTGLSGKVGAQVPSSDQKIPVITHDSLATVRQHRRTADCFPAVTSPTIIYTLESISPYGFIRALLNSCTACRAVLHLDTIRSKCETRTLTQTIIVFFTRFDTTITTSSSRG